TGGLLDAPWGMVLAADNFGFASRTLLVGNFGDGKITAMSPRDGTIFGQLADQQGAAIAIEGLWGLTFGTDSIPRNDVLYFAAGPDDEAHGLYGRIQIAEQKY